jgi:pimeloyl-ACP methyl ester carboxylesterase
MARLLPRGWTLAFAVFGLLSISCVSASLGSASLVSSRGASTGHKAAVLEAMKRLKHRMALDAPAGGRSVGIETPPDLCIRVAQMGYPCEHLNATTMDGWVLNVLRIPPKDANSTHATPVIMQHGLLMTSATYLGNMDGALNLATILHDQGYDCYLPNSRGNHYSLTNLRYPTQNATYWMDVDFDEMASMDVPAVIDTVLSHNRANTASNASTVTWVGHSQGTAMMFAGMSLTARPYADKINLFVALAPVAYVGHSTSLLLRLLADFDVANWIDDFGILSFLEDDWLVHLVADACPDIGDLCEDILGAVLGYGNMSNFALDLYPSITQYTPGGTSTSNLIHWAQEVDSNNFQMHDFGPTINIEFYHQLTPPMYNLSAYPATLPTVLVSGGVDALADPTDVARLVAELPAAAVIEHINVPNYAHMDFCWGLDAHYRIYPQILQYIAQYNKRS